MRKVLRGTGVLSAVLLAILVAMLYAQVMQAQDAHKPTIGFSIEATKGERWQTDLDSFQARAKQLGVEMISADAGGDDDRQCQQVQEMIKAGIKVLVLPPHDKRPARLVGMLKSFTVASAKDSH